MLYVEVRDRSKLAQQTNVLTRRFIVSEEHGLKMIVTKFETETFAGNRTIIYEVKYAQGGESRSETVICVREDYEFQINYILRQVNQMLADTQWPAIIRNHLNASHLAVFKQTGW